MLTASTGYVEEVNDRAPEGDPPQTDPQRGLAGPHGGAGQPDSGSRRHKLLRQCPGVQEEAPAPVVRGAAGESVQTRDGRSLPTGGGQTQGRAHVL